MYLPRPPLHWYNVHCTRIVVTTQLRYCFVNYFHNIFGTMVRCFSQCLVLLNPSLRPQMKSAALTQVASLRVTPIGKQTTDAMEKYNTGGSFPGGIDARARMMNKYGRIHKRGWQHCTARIVRFRVVPAHRAKAGPTPWHTHSSSSSGPGRTNSMASPAPALAPNSSLLSEPAERD